jgi:drug/metabolite transporter (DMT)-like permease
MKIFYKKQIQPLVYLGAFLGIIGISFIFSNELLQIKTRSTNLMGLGLGLIATFFASSGNILSYKNHLNKVPVSSSSAWGMFYGALVTLILALYQQKEFTFDFPSVYWYSLFYLSIFGTVIAFGAYFTLVGRIGAEKAGYTSILSPVIAISLSMFLENLKMTSYLAIGLLFCLFGNFITLRSKK